MFAYGVTDESFAVNLSRFLAPRAQPGVLSWDGNRALAVNHLANVTWIGATIAGGYAGALIPAGAFGIDYALIAMFLCLLVFQLRERIHAITALITGGLALILALLVPGNAYIVLASIIGATLGLVLKRYTALRKVRP